MRRRELHARVRAAMPRWLAAVLAWGEKRREAARIRRALETWPHEGER